MNDSWFLIANPTAGNKKFSKNWKKINQYLTKNAISFDFEFTKYAKHEIEIVDTIIKNGYKKIISVGGDGTLHNIVNGIFKQKYLKPSQITVAVIPIGTGNDWIKTYNIPNNIKGAIDILKKEKTIYQDIGILKLNNKTIYFNNLAGIGYDGYVVHKTNTLKHFGSLSYLLGGLLALFSYKKNRYKIEVNKNTIETTCLMILFGICKYSGGGMQLTNYKNKKSGFFNITIVKNFTFYDIILNIKKLYNGTIINHNEVEILQTNKLNITSISNSESYIQADGEVIQADKINIDIIKNALKVVVQ